MFTLLRHLGTDLRRSPLYAGLLGLGLAAFLALGLRGSRLIGDDNESSETERGGPGNTLTGRAHGGHGIFYHK